MTKQKVVKNLSKRYTDLKINVLLRIISAFYFFSKKFQKSVVFTKTSVFNKKFHKRWNKSDVFFLFIRGGEKSGKKCIFL